MEPYRIEAYLRSICSVLDFDIGELWCASKPAGQAPSLKFIQLYSSPTYEDFHSLLIQPNSNNGSSDEDTHRFSPVICRGVCDGGQIVWANTNISQGGLTGRTDMPLNTAVGVPICSIGSDLYMLVLFAVELILMSNSAVEFLMNLARAVTLNSGGFSSASLTNELSSPKARDFVGVWDITDLMKRYEKDVVFHMLPMGKLQKFFDCQEVLLFCDLFHDFKISRDGRFTTKQLESVKDTFRASARERSDSISSETSRTWELYPNALPTSDEASPEDPFSIPLSQVPSSPIQKQKQVLEPAGVPLSAGHCTARGVEGSGVYSAEIASIDYEICPDRDEFQASDRTRGVSVEDHFMLRMYTSLGFKLNQCRFHEFMISILGMTVFDCAELWLLSERTSELFLASAVYRSEVMQKWITFSESLRLKPGCDVPGKAFDSAEFCWEPRYSDSEEKQTEVVYNPRLQRARELGIISALGVPLPGLQGVCGALTFYSSEPKFEAEPLMVRLIEKGVQILAATSLDLDVFRKLEQRQQVKDRNLRTLNTSLCEWLQENGSSSQLINSRLQELKRTDGSVFGGSNTLSSFSDFSDFRSRLKVCQSLVYRRKSVKELEADGSSSDFMMTEIAMATKERSDGLRVDSSSESGCGDLCAPCDPDIPFASSLSMTDGCSWQQITRDKNIANGLNLSDNMDYFVQTATSGKKKRGRGDKDQKRNFENPTIHAAYALASIGSMEWQKSQTVEVPLKEMDFRGSKERKLDDAHSNSMYRHQDSSVLVKYTPFGLSGSPLTECKMEGCTAKVDSSNSCCPVHRDSRRCQKEGCTKCAQGATKFCIAHGGGRRCTFPGCFKGARDKNFCAAHGGGKRCTFHGCTKSAVGGSQLCTAHGGGKRCQFQGCTKSSQSSTNFCVKHGGGKTCVFPSCSKVARGRTDFCAAHGGGARCKTKGCHKLAVNAEGHCRLHGNDERHLVTLLSHSNGQAVAF